MDKHSLSSDFVSADQYVRSARLPRSGKSLQRWCDKNPFLADALHEVKLPGGRLYDARTAPNFRKLWVEAEARLKAERRKAEQVAQERFGGGDSAADSERSLP